MLTDTSGRVWTASGLPPGATVAEPVEGVVTKPVPGQPRVSDLYVGPLTHDSLVVVEVPVELDGRQAYSLAMAFPPSMFTPVLDNRRGAEDRRAAVVDGNGLTLAQSSNAGDFVGRHIGTAWIAAVGRGEAVFEATSLDRRPRARHRLVNARGHTPGPKHHSAECAYTEQEK